MRTNTGREWQKGVMGDTASTGTGVYASANYIALTANTGAPAAGDSVLTGEYAAASGGLVRKRAAYAVNSGSSFYVLTATFTMNVNDGASTQPFKYGIFTLASVGIMAFTDLIPNPPTMVPGDALAVTETVNI